ncbi:MAG: ArnT family glycosyltransferase [Phycisphaerae bacterium]
MTANTTDVESRADTPGDSTARLPEWPTRRLAAWLLLAIVLATICVDRFFFNGFYASDDRAYFSAAVRINSEGTLSPTPLVGHERLTVVGWIMLVGRLFGFNIQVASVSFVFFHAALVVLVFAAGRMLLDRLAGLLGAWFTATFPLFVMFSTSIFPDLPIACFFVLSLLLFLKAFAVRRRGKLVSTLLLMFGSGASVGLAYMAKEAGLVVLPLFFFAWMLTELTARRRTTAPAKPRRRLVRSLATGAMFAAGFFTVAGVEYLILSDLTGRSFVRMAAREKEHDLESVPNFHRDGGYDPVARFKAAMDRLGPDYLPDRWKWWLGGALVLFPIVVRRHWTAYFMGIWIFAFLTWGTYSLRHYYPPRLQPRYYIPAFPFLLLLLSVTLSVLVARLRRPGRAHAVRGWLARLVLLALIVEPLAHFDVPDRRAGRLYRTAFVRNTASAVRQARAEGAERTVIGWYFGTRLWPLWYGGTPPDAMARRPAGVLLAGDVSKAACAGFLARGSFHYITGPRRIRESDTCPPLRTVDDLVTPALWSNVPVRRSTLDPVNERPPRPVFYMSVEPDRPGLVEYEGFALRPMLRGRYDRVFERRTTELVHRLTSSMRFGRNVLHRTHEPVWLYEVAVRPGVWVHETTRDLTPWMQPDAELRDESGEIREDFRLPAHRQFRLTVDLDVPDETRVPCTLQVYADADGREPVASRALTLTGGRNAFGLSTAEADRYLLPVFDSNGAIGSKILRFRLEAGRCATADVN